MMRGLALVLICAALCSCTTAVGVLGRALGGGPDVAANVQAGRTNAQTVGQAAISDQRMVRPEARTIEQSTGRTGVRSENVQTVLVQNAPPPWLLLVALLGWLLPTPVQIGAALAAGLRRVLSWVSPARGATGS